MRLLPCVSCLLAIATQIPTANLGYIPVRAVFANGKRAKSAARENEMPRRRAYRAL
jgi:hypothetical protein